jgi:hypothetical protein
MAMTPSSAHFTLWRQGTGSATNYALYSSIGGFASGQQLAQAHVTSTGAASQLALGGPFATAISTTSPVEFRLYGWGAASALDSTHVVAAALQANFTSLAGVPIDPTGSLTVQGNFYHLDDGILSIDLAGVQPGINYDAVNVTGQIDLAGNLSVNLADTGNGTFSPLLGDSFSILTATQGITGSFANVSLPQLVWNLDWRLDYLANAVNLVVWSSGDFNHDGLVNAVDYVVWRKNGGTQSELDTWRSRYGLTAGIGAQLGVAASSAVPEPSSALILVVALFACLLADRRRVAWWGRT